MKKIIRVFFLSIFFLLAALSLWTCNKDQPTKADITVVDSLNKVVPSATVTLWQDSLISVQSGQKANVRVTKITDSGGFVSFEFAQEAYLNITVVKGQDSTRDYIQLMEHHTVSKTVQLY